MNIDLSGKWILYNNQKEICSIDIPGDIFSGLIKEDLTTNPYYGLNELDFLQLAKENWSLSREFCIKDLSCKGIFLNIDSLDTYCYIFINSKLVGKSENMFIPFNLDIKNQLQVGKNTITIDFESAEKKALKLEKKHPYPVPLMHAPIQSPARNFTRKVQCHSGWDWGPSLMVSGIYNSITLNGYNYGRVSNWDLKYEIESNIADIIIDFNYFSFYTGVESFTILDGEKTLTFKREVTTGNNNLSFMFSKKNIDLWWPNGYGNQPLYTFTLKTEDETLKKRIGFRKLEVISENDVIGKSLYFRVNDVDIFCKGANWIPTDALPSNQTPDKYKRLISDAKDANMNMLRVWGGGQYEKNIFYDLCDEEGILIWQDMMFSCSIYPANNEFLSSVDLEVKAQVSRLKHHPSIALWCGNNENVGALTWFEETRKNRDVYIVDYDRLNEGVIGKNIKNMDPDRKWWPSSPCAGENDYSDCWHDDSKGDMHYWRVWHEGQSFDSYYSVIPRFCSEFGYQSYPSFSTIRSFAPKDQWNITSPIMEHHQRSTKGNQLILETISRYFRIPKDFKNYLYISQIQQSNAIKTAVEYWRSNRPICMGILYWQLNDLWPVSSWSSVEYSGKWKPLHYEIKRVYEPVHIYSYIKDNIINIGIINDTLKEVEGFVDINLYSFTGEKLWNTELTVSILRENTIKLLEVNINDLETVPDSAFFHSILRLKERDTASTLFITEPKKCNLKKCAIKSKIIGTDNGVDITLSTNYPVFNVVIDIDDINGILSDNNFTLLPKEDITVSLKTKDNYAIDEIINKIEIYSLNSSY